MGRSDRQHLFIPREDYSLFLAVSIYFAGPKYAMALWLCMVTSRRISETLRLHGSDLYLSGGQFHDSPHILFQRRKAEAQFPGAGKLGADHIVARLSPDACATLEAVHGTKIERALLPALHPFQKTHKEVFEESYPLTTEAFSWPEGDAFVFPAATKKSKKPWMARQSVSKALARILDIMFRLTGKRRWNKMFKGSHVTVHGATRHTAAALLLAKPKEGNPGPSEHVIMEIQQRHDLRTFHRHYCHAQEHEVGKALEHVSVPISFHAAEKPDASQNAACATSVAAADAMPMSAGAAGGDESRASGPEAPAAAVPPGKSRNAWRKQKRKVGKLAWQASQCNPGQE